MVASNLKEMEDGLQEFDALIPAFSSSLILLERYARITSGPNAKDVQAHSDALRRQLAVALHEQKELAIAISKGGFEHPEAPTSVVPSPEVPTVSQAEIAAEDEAAHQRTASMEKLLPFVDETNRHIEILRRFIEGFKNECEELETILMSPNPDMQRILAIEKKLDTDITDLEKAMNVETSQYLSRFTQVLGTDIAQIEAAHKQVSDEFGKLFAGVDAQTTKAWADFFDTVQNLIRLLTIDAREAQAAKEQFNRLKTIIAQYSRAPENTSLHEKAKAEAKELTKTEQAIYKTEPKIVQAEQNLLAQRHELMRRQKELDAARKNVLTRKGQIVDSYNQYLRVIQNCVTYIEVSPSISSEGRVKREAHYMDIKEMKPLTLRTPFKQLKIEFAALANISEHFMQKLSPQEKMNLSKYANTLAGAIIKINKQIIPTLDRF